MKRKAITLILLTIILFPVSAWAGLTKTQVSQLYVSIFGRASEGEGNAFWQSQPDMATAAAAMLDTDAARNYFGANLNTNQAFVEHIYLNTLNKTISDDFDGISYWVDMLESGTSRGEAVVTLVGAINDYAPDGLYYNPNDTATVAAYNQFMNRVEVSDYMADNVYATPDDWETSTSFSQGIIVTDDPATVIASMTIVNGFTQENWDFVEFGKKLLADNPELQKASNLEKAQAAFDAYMNFLTEQEAGITGTIGDSIWHTIEGTRNDPKKVLNCDQHTHNFLAIFEELAVNEKGKIEGFPISHLTMTKPGPLGYNPLDVNAQHTAILIRDNDGKIYVFDPWMHAMDIRALFPEFNQFYPDVVRTLGLLVYGDWETSQYRGMPIDEYENVVWSKYWYILDPFDRFRDWQPGQRPVNPPPMKPIDEVIDDCVTFCYGDSEEAIWLINNQYNDRQDSCYMDCINWGVEAMKQMVPNDEGGYYQLIETIATPGGNDYEKQRTARIKIEVSATWSEGSVSSTTNYFFDGKPDGQFIASLTWAPPPQKIYPDVETPLNLAVTGTATVDSGSRGNHGGAIWRDNYFVCGVNVFTGAAGTRVSECENPLTVRGSAAPKQSFELIYAISINHMSTSGQGKYVYVYQWVP